MSSTTCVNPSCRRGLDPSWAFCPMCGADNRAPSRRVGVTGCRHLHFQGATFCPSCGQPLAAVSQPVAVPRVPAPLPHPVFTQKRSNPVLWTVCILVGCVFMFCLFLIGTSSPTAQPPFPCARLTIGMTEDEALAIMGEPYSREFREPDINSPGGWYLEWPNGLGREWQSSCSAFFINERLDMANFIHHGGPYFNKMSGVEGGKWR